MPSGNVPSVQGAERLENNARVIGNSLQGSFLHAVQDVIHIEVKKLNPDAILPEFEFIAETDDHLSLIYKSPRHLCYFCEGLIHGLAQHTGQEVKVSQSECVHESGHRCVIEVSKL